ncbi:MAG: hypothetical protein DCC55_05635 [Chloroflexi bacterium]|nr:MAG: hypothetical protein DCC55_05635 [Chloroflexota bacterium]
MPEQKLPQEVQTKYTVGEQFAIMIGANPQTLRATAGEHTDLLLDLLPVAMYTCDSEGLITYFNPRAAEIWGRKPRLNEPDERFCGSFRLFRLDGALLPHAETPMAVAVQTGQRIRNAEVVVERPDGSHVYVAVNIDPILDQNGRRVGAINVFEDITPRKEAETALRLSEERQRTLLQIMPTAMFICDSEGLISYYNQRAAELWGRHPKLHDPADRFCGSFRIYRPDGSLLSHEKCPMAVAVLTGQGTRNETIHIERPDGTIIIASVNIDPLFDEAGRQVGAINVFEDITRRQQAEKELRQARDQLEQRVAERTLELERRNRELDQFAYAASHDLRSPLRAIDALSRWIVEDCAKILPPASRVHLDKLRRRVQRMEQLLNDLLAYSRADRHYSASETVDTALLVHSVVEWIAPPAGFTVTVARAMPVLRTERIPLELVFRNLLDNALKHHHQPQLARIHVSAREENRCIEFAVTDNGPGIDSLFHNRIFQVFQTLNPRDKVEGSGMGLAMVKKIVEQRGGRVWLASAVGEGATFYFTWPTEAI